MMDTKYVFFSAHPCFVGEFIVVRGHLLARESNSIVGGWLGMGKCIRLG